MLLEKEVIRPGTYWYRDESSGKPRKLVVTPELTKYWHEQGNAMLSSGLTVPVPCEHDFDAHPMTPSDKLKNNAGWVTGYSLKGDALFSSVDVQDEELAKRLPNTIRWTSPWINSFIDGKGKEWKNVISHLALTTRPRIVDQQPFGSIAAALSMATTTVLDGSSIAMTTDELDRNRDEKGQFAKNASDEAEKASRRTRHERLIKKARTVASIAGEGDHELAGDYHEIAADEHNDIAEDYEEGGGEESARKHRKAAKAHSIAAKAHREAHEYKSKTMSVGSGFCLSRAGILNDDGKPLFSAAFGMWSGIKSLVTGDKKGPAHKGKGAGGGQFTSSGVYGGKEPKGQQFTASGVYVGDKGKTRDHGQKKDYAEARDKARAASSEAEKHSSSAKSAIDHTKAGASHREATQHHLRAASMTNDDRDMDAHFDAAAEHRNKSNEHYGKAGVKLALDSNNKKPPPVDDDLKNEGDTDAEEMESEGDDLGTDDQSDIDDNGSGTVEMEEILCHLLQALGVPMPDNSNKNEFHRHLYEAAMSKIKELTSKGMGKEDVKPDQNKPPNQQPNASQPKQQQNPLIQQEPQPMFMSLEEIKELPDPMRGVALAMYNENEKLRAQVEANQKVTDGLRNKQLKEAEAQRATRITLLTKLSPRAKGDIEAMLAQPNMALSMDDRGTIIDPMAQTLSVLEKGLADLPWLLTNDAAMSTVHAQPQDADMLTPERADELADIMARQMGCTTAAR